MDGAYTYVPNLHVETNGAITAKNQRWIRSKIFLHCGSPQETVLLARTGSAGANGQPTAAQDPCQWMVCQCALHQHLSGTLFPSLGLPPLQSASS